MTQVSTFERSEWPAKVTVTVRSLLNTGIGGSSGEFTTATHDLNVTGLCSDSVIRKVKDYYIQQEGANLISIVIDRVWWYQASEVPGVVVDL
jgi:hypothetical protein